MASKTHVGVGGPVRNYTRPLPGKPESAEPITRIGVGGPVRNYTRPMADKPPFIPPEPAEGGAQRLWMVNLNRGMNM